MEFPRSCVLYLRSNRNTPDFLEADVIFPDGKTHLYQIPTIKMKNYTSSTIFEKNLLMLLPFYIMRYEKSAHDMSEKPELFQEMLNEYEEIRHRLAREAAKEAAKEAEERVSVLINKLILDGRSDEIQKVVTDPELRKQMYKEYGLQ